MFADIAEQGTLLGMFAVTFPGQGSQNPGMGVALCTQYSSSKEVFSEVSEAVGNDILALCRDSDEDTLRLTQNAQIALFTTGLAAWRALHSEIKTMPSFFAGHSVGEYAAMVASGALSLADGARLIKVRGDLMAQADSGAMAAVLGLDREPLAEALSDVRGVVVIANDNCPGQLVISGEPNAVERACAAALSMGAKRAMPLNVSGAFHSPLMHDAAQQMKEALEKVQFTTPAVPVVSNVTAEPETDATKFATLLAEQLESSVRWSESMSAMVAAGCKQFVECGHGAVLTGLLKRIDRESIGMACGDPESVLAVSQKLKEHTHAV